MSNNNGKKWSEKEVSFLQRNYGKLPVSEVAKALGRTKYSVESKAAALRKIEVKAPVKIKVKQTSKVSKVTIGNGKPIGPANPAFGGSDDVQPKITRKPKKRGFWSRLLG